MVLVRNAKRYPRNPEDGASVKHRAGLANDTKPRQFHTYRYSLFAIYRSYNHSHSYRSPGLHIRVHLGRICQPRDGGSIRDLTPKVDWTKYTGTTSYAFILQRGSSTLLVRYPHKSFYQFATLVDVPPRPALARARRDVPLLPVRLHAHAPQRRDHRAHHLDRALTR